MALSSEEDELQEQFHGISETISISSDENSRDGDLPEGPLSSQSDMSRVDHNMQLTVSSNTSASQPSTSSQVTRALNGDDVSKLQDMFRDNLSVSQIESIYKASGNNFTSTMECLLKGPSLQSIKNMFNSRFSCCATVKVQIDPCEAWEEFVAFYKSPHLDVTKQLRIQLNDQPAVDVGGVHAQLYTTVLDDFSQNRRIRLFDGSPRWLCPHYSAESRSSGLFKVLGTMVGHALAQDGIGFPYFSPLCYWYIVDGEERALQNLSMNDVGKNVEVFLTEVWHFTV